MIIALGAVVNCGLQVWTESYTESWSGSEYGNWSSINYFWRSRCDNEGCSKTDTFYWSDFDIEHKI